MRIKSKSKNLVLFLVLIFVFSWFPYKSLLFLVLFFGFDSCFSWLPGFPINLLGFGLWFGCLFLFLVSCVPYKTLLPFHTLD